MKYNEKKHMLVHESGNPHYAEGQIIHSEAEKGVSVKPKRIGKIVTNEKHHNELPILWKKNPIGFVRTATITGEVRRIKD